MFENVYSSTKQAADASLRLKSDLLDGVFFAFEIKANQRKVRN